MVLILIVGCVVPGSYHYKPFPWEEELYKSHSIFPFPNDIDVRNSGAKVQWVGHFTDYSIKDLGDSLLLIVPVEHKHWDYVIDRSIQAEQMFVSNLGAGTFVYEKVVHGHTLDSLTKIFDNYKEHFQLGIFYGNTKVENGVVKLINGSSRYFHRVIYSFDIFEYEYEIENGKPKIVNHQVLKIAQPGINDEEDKHYR